MGSVEHRITTTIRKRGTTVWFEHVALSMTILLVSGSGSGGVSTTQPTDTTDQPPDDTGLIVDWEPDKVLTLDEPWAIHACEGEAPVLCVERDGTVVGAVEALTHPIDSFDDLDPDTVNDQILTTFAQGFLDAMIADRAAGCGGVYKVETIGPEPFVLGDTPGIAYGFAGTTSDGRSSELNRQYATVVEDLIVSLVAIAYDEGGCPGRDETSGFDSANLTEFRPHLENILHATPLPDMGP